MCEFQALQTDLRLHTVATWTLIKTPEEFSSHRDKFRVQVQSRTHGEVA